MGFIFKKVSLLKIIVWAIVILLLMATLIRGIAQDVIIGK